MQLIVNMKKPKLILDLGNSRWKLALFQGKELEQLKIVDSNKPGEAISWIRSLAGFSSCLLSSVVEVPAAMTQLLKQMGNYYELNESSSLPISNIYLTQSSLGKDRLAAAVGASTIFPGKNILVFIAGTCITHELINTQKEYLGGAIAPGIRMRLQALHTFTDKLPLVPFLEKDIMIGRDTESSILSGVLNGCVLEMEGFIGHYRRLFPDLQIILSGGDADYFEKRMKSSIFAAPNIVLKGLNEILDHNA